MLTFYELDLGLNHVVRKWSEPTDPRANLLVQGQCALCVGFTRHLLIPLLNQFPEVSRLQQTDGKALLVFSFAVKITSSTETWMPRNTEFRFLKG